MRGLRSLSAIRDNRSKRSRTAFFWGLETFVVLLGVLALALPIESGVLVTRLLGLLLMLAGFVALLASPGHGRGGRAVVAGAIVAFASGALVQWIPANGIPSLGSLVGLLLVGHGAAASSVALRRWRRMKRTRLRLAVGLLASLMLLVGLAMLVGEDVGERLERVIVGVDIVLFGAFLAVTRLMVDVEQSNGR